MLTDTGYATQSLLDVHYIENARLYAQWYGYLTLPTPIKTNYLFEGWYKEPECVNLVAYGGEKYLPSTNVTLYAKWRENFVMFTSTSSFTLSKVNGVKWDGTVYYSTSLSSENWATSVWDGSSVASAYDSNLGKYVLYLKGINNTYLSGFDFNTVGSWTSTNYQWTISGSNNLTLSGNFESLLDWEVVNKSKSPNLNGHPTVGKAAAQYLFRAIPITTVSKDFLPSPVLAVDCYRDMFRGCTKLVQAPDLPAMTLAPGCYASMFRDCSALVVAPGLPANLSLMYSGVYATEYCAQMFSACGKLTTVPMLTYGTYFPVDALKSFLQNTGAYIETTNPNDDYSVYLDLTNVTGLTSAFNGTFSGTKGSFKGSPALGNIYYITSPVVSAVSFDLQGGTSLTTYVSAIKGSPMPFAIAPVKQGYTFGGYYASANGVGKKYYNADMSSANDWDKDANTKLYAKWIANEYRILFNGNGGDGETISQILRYGVAQNLHANTYTRSGYAFNGWNTAIDGLGTSYSNNQEVINLLTRSNDILVLYAQWQPAGSAVATISNVSITGSNIVGQTLTATCAYTGDAALIYRWSSSSDGTNYTNIIGANSNTYTLTENEIGKYMRVTISAGASPIYAAVAGVSTETNTVCTASTFILTLTKNANVEAIYYKINGADNYSSTTTSTTFNVNAGSVIYLYATVAGGYTTPYYDASHAYSQTMSSSYEFSPAATLVSYILTLTKNANIEAIYYKINGAENYSSTNVSTTLEVNPNSTIYLYATPATNYSTTYYDASHAYSQQMISGYEFSPVANMITYNLTLTMNPNINTIYYKINGAANYSSTITSKVVQVNKNSTIYVYATTFVHYETTYNDENHVYSQVMNGPYTFSPVATRIMYTLTLTKNANIENIYYKVNGASDYSLTTTSTTVQVNSGTQIYLYATPSTYYSTTYYDASHNYSQTMTGAYEFSPTASQLSYTITLTINENINSIAYKVGDAQEYTLINTARQLYIGGGETIYLYATPASGYSTTYYNSSNAYEHLVTGNYEFSPTATLVSYTLTLEINPHITAIYYKVNGADNYTYTNVNQNLQIDVGTTIYLYATTDYSYGTTYNSSSNAYTRTMTGAYTFSPTATKITYSLTLTKNANIERIYYKIGDVANYSYAATSATISVDMGSTVYMYATPASGYTTTYYDASNTYSRTMTDNYTFSPVATKISYDLTLTINSNIERIYYKIAGEQNYQTTAVTTTVQIPNGRTIYCYAVPATYYRTLYTEQNNYSRSMTEDYDFSPTAIRIAYNLTLTLNQNINSLAYKLGDQGIYYTTYQSNVVAVDAGTTVSLYAVCTTGYTTTYYDSNHAYTQLMTGNYEFSPVATVATYTVTFNSNGGSGTMNSQTFTYGVSQALTPNAFIKTLTTEGGTAYYDFLGWAESANGSVVYANGESISISANKVLYAKWSKLGEMQMGTYTQGGNTYNLVWDVLDTFTVGDDEYALVVSEYVIYLPTTAEKLWLDTRADHTYDIDNDGIADSIYASNYYLSNTRAVLNSYDGSAYGVSDYTNGGFFANCTFTQSQLNAIQKARVYWNANETGIGTNQIGSSKNMATSASMIDNNGDYFFLLDTSDIHNSAYYSSESERIRTDITDGTTARGYWLRTADYTLSQIDPTAETSMVCKMSSSGGDGSSAVNNDWWMNGLVPAMFVKI